MVVVMVRRKRLWTTENGKNGRQAAVVDVSQGQGEDGNDLFEPKGGKRTVGARIQTRSTGRQQRAERQAMGERRRRCSALFSAKGEKRPNTRHSTAVFQV